VGGLPADGYITGAVGGRDYRALVPIVCSVEESEMGYGSVGRSGGYTAVEIYNYVNTVMRASHMLWTYNLCPSPPATAAQKWPTGILPVINGSPLTYTQRRTNW
jgi:hypothetical protein